MVKMVWLLEQPFSHFGHFKIHASHSLRMVGIVRAVTARPPHATHMTMSRAIISCHHAWLVEPPKFG